MAPSGGEPLGAASIGGIFGLLALPVERGRVSVVGASAANRRFPYQLRRFMTLTSRAWI
eukprot:CAMPEP_0201617632 /NCGR_PEP_ID=MMETSP0492-20130828/36817_1 /ASSEMBLY_ACC=CAM_ASM_000837 /TAXON_ID=420259 /ORGANISM="Thalassiosira gravida, Strain GMp14c1" /LENGTH=58 /DNA_ID=CAMNT_0048085941 /DNA_START=77 /DNA_END=253 /DNA_ORIENTATION=+